MSLSLGAVCYAAIENQRKGKEGTKNSSVHYGEMNYTYFMK